MGDLSSDTLFHVMDDKTSFKLLLGRPWKHENGVVASTLHQCLKYYRGGERKIDGDAKTFSKVDSFFADAKFFEENGTSSEFMPTTISSTGKGGKREKNIIKEDEAASHAKENDVKKEVDKASKTTTPVASPKKQEMTHKTTPPVLRYILKSRRKDGESPFAECLIPKIEPKDKKSSLVFKQEWVAKVVTPLPSSSQTKIVRPPPNGFVCSSSQSSSEGNKGIFDSNAYKLLAKARYDFTNPTPLGKVIEVEPYGLNKSQHEVFKQDGSFMCMQVVDINQHEPLKARRRVLVLTGQQKNAEELVPSSSRPCDTKKSSDLEITTSSYHITVEEIPDENEEVEADEAPETLEDGGQSTVDELKELNLGTIEDPRPIYVSTLLTKEEEEEYYKLLVEYKDVFALSYKEMPGLSPTIAVHRLAIKKGTCPKKQPQRRFRPELVPEIEKEVNKLIEAGFIREVKYSTWIANIVPVRKKNGQLRICVHFRDLNDACPKDDFPLPKLRHYMQAYTIHVVSKADPIKYILSRPVLSGRLAKWAMLLKQYDLVFVPQKAVKGQAIADFFADHLVPAEWEISDDLPKEEIFYVDVLPPWQMYFDGAERLDGAGAGVVFVTPQNRLMPYAFTLT
ncbi:uncharacterized protein LOC141631807 [Silene latifolia]|uniref:uncharacterized protein LOC141631807 n=1 Tax=Silene latifolia TaxID=37657 RepID=UPI003D771B77